jgi:integrase
VLLSELLDAVEGDYQVNGRRSLDTLKGRLKPVRAAFGLDRALDVSEDRIERYKAARLGDKMAPATVNRELAALKRAFRLAIRQKRLTTMPAITLLAEHNVRQGFAEPAAIAEVIHHLPRYLQNLTRFAYLCGWRKGELTTLQWPDVDRAGQRILLRREHSKNEEPRVLVLTGQLWAVIEEQWAAREYRRPDGTVGISRYVFHRGERAVGNFRRAWRRACKVAGLPGFLFHDLRRSAIRNMERAGVSQAVAMRVSGHKSASVYRRYRIVSEEDLREAVDRTQAFVNRIAQQAAVIPFSIGGGTRV